jgi:hypothetical protein
MLKNRLKRQLLKKKLFTKNRLVILNEDTFEEVFSLRLTLMNVFVVASIAGILIVFITTYIIAFTPLREYIPGYASTELRRNATELAIKSDSLTNAIRKNESYLKAVQKVLNGELEFAKVNKDSLLAADVVAPKTEDITASDAEIELREQVQEAEKQQFELSHKKNVRK